MVSSENERFVWSDDVNFTFYVHRWLFFSRVIYATGSLCILPIETKVKKVTILVSVSVVSGSIVFYCFFFNFSFGASDPIQKVFYILSFVRNYFFAWA